MLLVFGIGNPGPEYVGTRHNLGFELLDRLSPEPFSRLPGYPAEAARMKVRVAGAPDRTLLLVRPLTYVNRCGPVLASLLKQEGLTPEHCLVAVDDIDLPTGTIRLRGEGGPGGHNGLRSIEAALESSAYPRLRLGVGGDDARAHPDYVLGRFPEDDHASVARSLDRAAKAVVEWATNGLQAAMTEANRRLLDPDGTRP